MLFSSSYFQLTRETWHFHEVTDKGHYNDKGKEKKERRKELHTIRDLNPQPLDHEANALPLCH